MRNLAFHDDDYLLPILETDNTHLFMDVHTYVYHGGDLLCRLFERQSSIRSQGSSLIAA